MNTPTTLKVGEPVCRPETDQYGYDLVLTCGTVTRHVQLKSSRHDAKTRKQTIGLDLVAKPSGCVVWVILDTRDDGLGVAHYLVLSGKPGEPLPGLGDKVGRNPRSKTPRPRTREVAKSRFDREADSPALFRRLFG